jgi:hypothetical protein
MDKYDGIISMLTVVEFISHLHHYNCDDSPLCNSHTDLREAGLGFASLGLHV